MKWVRPLRTVTLTLTLSGSLSQFGFVANIGFAQDRPNLLVIMAIDVRSCVMCHLPMP